jgi:predicted dehydrogenase
MVNRFEGELMRNLRIGLAGLGHGMSLLQANLPWDKLPTVNYGEMPLRVTSLCDTDEKKLASTAKKWEIPDTTTDFDELIARKDIDIVGIYTPGPLHCEQILAALDAGKHVMVTKAMVYTMEEAERIVEAVDRTGLVLLVTQTMRGRYELIDAKRRCDAGELGDLFLADAHYVHDLRHNFTQTPWRVQMPQDLMLGGACHPIDLLRWFMGDIDEVHCYAIRGGVAEKYPKEDNFVINVKFKSGKIGRVANYLGTIDPPDWPMVSLTVLGTRGVFRDNKMHVDPVGDVPHRTCEVHYHAVPDHEGEMVVMMHHMAECINKSIEPWVGAREGAQVVSTCLACWESHHTGHPVKVRNEF